MKTTKELFEMVKKYLESNFFFADEQQATIVSTYVLLTWIYDQFPHCPYLLIEGEPGTGKTMLGHVLSKVVYNFIEPEACSVEALFRIVDKNPGTVIFDNADLIANIKTEDSGDFTKLLNIGFQSHGIVYRAVEESLEDISEKSFNTYCPKILFVIPDEKNIDRSIFSRSVRLVMKNDVSIGELRSRNIPIHHSTEKLEEESRELKQELAIWRDVKISEKISLDYLLIDDDYSARAGMKILPLLTIFNEFANANEIFRFKEFVENDNANSKVGRYFLVNRHLVKICKDESLYKELIREGKNGEQQFLIKEFASVIREKSRVDITTFKLGRILRDDLHLEGTRSSEGFVFTLNERFLKLHITSAMKTGEEK